MENLKLTQLIRTKFKQARSRPEAVRNEGPRRLSKVPIALMLESTGVWGVWNDAQSSGRIARLAPRRANGPSG